LVLADSSKIHVIMDLGLKYSSGTSCVFGSIDIIKTVKCQKQWNSVFISQRNRNLKNLLLIEKKLSVLPTLSIANDLNCKRGNSCHNPC